MSNFGKISLFLFIVLVALSCMVYRQQEQIDAMQERIQQLQDSNARIQDRLEKLQNQIYDLDENQHPDPAVRRFLNSTN
jgi:cell division protein FtsB